MNLQERLVDWDGKDVAKLEEVFDLLGERGDFVEQLLAGLAGDDPLQIGASWMLKRWLELGGRLGPRETARVVAALAELRPWEARLHLLQSLRWLDLRARSRAAAERFVRAALESEVKFVQAWAYSGLHELARSFEELRPEAEALMEQALVAGPASVRARIRQLRKRGYPVGPEAPPGKGRGRGRRGPV